VIKIQNAPAAAKAFGNQREHALVDKVYAEMGHARGGEQAAWWPGLSVSGGTGSATFLDASV